MTTHFSSRLPTHVNIEDAPSKYAFHFRQLDHSSRWSRLDFSTKEWRRHDRVFVEQFLWANDTVSVPAMVATSGQFKRLGYQVAENILPYSMFPSHGRQSRRPFRSRERARSRSNVRQIKTSHVYSQETRFAHHALQRSRRRER